MIYPKPKTETEKRQLHRMSYELQKEELIAFHKEQGYDIKTLNEFLVNSLKADYEAELKEDGLM